MLLSVCYCLHVTVCMLLFAYYFLYAIVCMLLFACYCRNDELTFRSWMLFKMLEAHPLIVVMLCSCGCWMGQEWIRMDFGPKCSRQWAKVPV
jgi:hypothetical protein